jgi:outer membrane receptor for ferrienterochelin and colicins
MAIFFYPHFKTMKKLIGFLFLLPSLMFGQQKDSLTTVIKDVICTAEIGKTDVRKAVYPTRVITAEVIQRRAANNLEEVLQGEVNMRLSSDLILGSGLQINGVGGENIKVMIDGVPVVGRLNGNVDLSQIMLQNVEKIEIIQGAVNGMYGSNASGGVINVITKKTQVSPYEATISGQQESVGIENISFAGGLKKGKMLVRASGSYYNFSGYPADSLRSSLWNPKKQYSAQILAKYYINDNNQINYTYNYLDEKVENLGDIKRPNFKPYAFDDFYYTTRNDHALNYDGKIKKMNIQSTLGFNDFYRIKNAYRTDIESSEGKIIDSEQDTSRFRAILSRTVLNRNINKNISLAIGSDIYYENARGKRIKDTTQTNSNFSDISDWGFFVGGKITTLNSRLTAQPMLRYTYNSKYDAPLTPSLNLKYSLSEQWSIRAGYARGFRAPSLKELYFNFIDISHYIIGDANLQAETSHNLYLRPSFSTKWGKNQMDFEANTFYNDIKNRIILAQFDFLKYSYTNIGEFRTKGAGINVGYNFDNRLAVKTGVVYTGYYNTARDEQPQLPVFLYSPDVNVDVTFSPEKIPVNFNVLYRFTGKTPTYIFLKDNKIEEGRIDSWSLLNATMGTHFWKKRIQVTVGVKNILDVQSIVTQGSIKVGHNDIAGQMPVNFGRSYITKINIRL